MFVIIDRMYVNMVCMFQSKNCSPSHTVPSPWKPSRQEQSNDPSMFVQTAFSWHGDLISHSLTSINFKY